MKVGFGLAGLHMKVALADESFPSFRNWPARDQQGPKMSEHQKYRKIKRHD